MEKTKNRTERSGQSPATAPANPVQLPGGLVYHHDLQEIDAATEGANLLDLQTRQDPIPLFSKKAKSVMVFF